MTRIVKMKFNKKILVVGILLLVVGFGLGKWAFPEPKERLPGVRYLIVNADDFGASEAITQGIIRAWQKGIVTSTSAQVNLTGAPERIRAAHAAYPDLPIGLHLDITEGKPVLPSDQVPSLIDQSGNFYSTDTITTHLTEISLTELRAELHAQAELLIHSGVKFDHIDYHNHMLALYTPFYPLVIELAQEYSVPVRQPVPESVYGQIHTQGGSGSAAAIQQMMTFGMRHPLLAMKMMPNMTPDAFEKQASQLDALGIPTPNWFVDAFYNNATIENMISILGQLPPGVSEMMVHPGLDDPRVEDPSAYTGRSLELKVLTDPAVRNTLKANQIRQIDFSFFK
jgi:predicted glycoside hydrolase/deacetylase ChbG (UPF0249 family)